jgi:putative ABC transport system permease protein
MPAIWHLRLLLRRLWRQPGFSAGAVGTLALGIAAPTALFAVVNATILRPLPYDRPDDIYFLETEFTDGRFTIGRVATEELAAFRAAAEPIAAAAWAYPMDDVVTAGADAQHVNVYGVSEEFFDLFGVPMALGRGLGRGDFEAQVPSAVLSHRLWLSRFGGDPAIVGQTIQLAGRRPVVVGVAPAGFDVPHDTDLWVNLRLPLSIGHLLLAYMRLQPGVGPDAVHEPMLRVFAELAEKYPDQERDRIFVILPLLETVVGDLGPTVLMAFGAAGLLMLLALVNVANLLLARGASRARELAVRSALGASRWRLARQIFAEALVLSAIGALVGTALAHAAIRVIVVVAGGAFPRVENMRIDGSVLLFTSAVATVASLLVALLPAFAAREAGLAAAMNEGGRAALQGRTTRRWLRAMVLGEVALAIALVAGAGRLVLSLEHLMAIDPGFRSDGRLVVDVLLPGQRYFAPAPQQAWFDQAEVALRSLGATRVGAATALPLHREWDSTTFVDIVGRPTPPERRPNGRLRRISPAFLDTLDIDVRSGRGFTTADRAGAAPVCLVNDAWVRRHLPGIEPLGERILPGAFFRRTPTGGTQEACDIVGVVADVRYTDVADDVEPIVYVPLAQSAIAHRSIVITTADGRPERLIPAIRTSLARLDAQVAIDIEPMSAAISPPLTWSRLGLFLMGAFGVAALMLAAVGVFGVISYVVAQRIGEMAVRMALGATRARVFAQVVLDAGRVLAAGAGLGLILAWWTGRLMGSYLHGAGATSLAVIGIATAIVLVVSLIAVMVPARAAARVAPGGVLRGSG